MADPAGFIISVVSFWKKIRYLEFKLKILVLTFQIFGKYSVRHKLVAIAIRFVDTHARYLSTDTKWISKIKIFLNINHSRKILKSVHYEKLLAKVNLVNRYFCLPNNIDSSLDLLTFTGLSVIYFDHFN